MTNQPITTACKMSTPTPNIQSNPQQSYFFPIRYRPYNVRERMCRNVHALDTTADDEGSLIPPTSATTTTTFFFPRLTLSTTPARHPFFSHLSPICVDRTPECCNRLNVAAAGESGMYRATPMCFNDVVGVFLLSINQEKYCVLGVSSLSLSPKPKSITFFCLKIFSVSF